MISIFKFGLQMYMYSLYLISGLGRNQSLTGEPCGLNGVGLRWRTQRKGVRFEVISWDKLLKHTFIHGTI